VPAIAILSTLILLLSACSGGTPTPPVKKLTDLDKVIINKMSVEQVYSLMTSDLKATSVLYPAQRVEETSTDNWVVASKSGGFAEGEEAPYQVLLFTPAKAGTEYYLVFFKDDAVFGTAWFTAQYGKLVEKILKGESITQ